MIGREEVNVQKTGSHKSFDVKDVTCSDVKDITCSGMGYGAIPVAQQRGFTCVSVPSCIYLMVSITKIPLLNRKFFSLL